MIESLKQRQNERRFAKVCNIFRQLNHYTLHFSNKEDTICAISSPQGMGAIALIRLSGNKAESIANQLFSKDLTKVPSNQTVYGTLSADNNLIDEVVTTVFRNPASFTGEDCVEISCHGSVFIQQKILKSLTDLGARIADPGEFSLRAFLNGKMDLSQTEAIADLIASTSEASHRLALDQMRGGYSNEIEDLRQHLLNFASLVELELDFSQEDVEFADRSQLEELIQKIKSKLNALASSFEYGNVIKNGVPVAIVGAPNAGKSTLLNALLNEEKAIVSDIAGTTRDVIEDTVTMDGIEFRFIDTAGIRDTKDVIESQGIRKAFEKIKQARIILLLIDLKEVNENEIIDQISLFEKRSVSKDQSLICLFNKSDLVEEGKYVKLKDMGMLISAKNGKEIHELKKVLVDQVNKNEHQFDTIVSNARHYDILRKSLDAIQKVEDGLKNEIPGDLLAMDIRETLNQLGLITGQVTTDDLLGNIFANFCIGK